MKIKFYQTILDISANTHKNDISYFCKMLEELKKIDRGSPPSKTWPHGQHEIIIKGQLFSEGTNLVNTVQDKGMFRQMYEAAKDYGYRLTASVFDMDSLKFLMEFDVPFIKIANNRSCDYLIDEIPRKIEVYRSVDSKAEAMPDWRYGNITELVCVSKYPATIKDYRNEFSFGLLYGYISDHTIGIELAKEYEPTIWEKHFKLPDSTGLDAGDWAITPEQLKEFRDVSW